MMTWAKVKTVAAGVTAAAVIGTGAAVTLNRAVAQDEGASRPFAGAPAQTLAAAAQAGKDAGKDERDREDKAMRARLQRELPEVNFDAVALRDVADFLTDVTSVPVIIDRPALTAAGIDPAKVTVTVKFQKVPFAKALEGVAEAVGTEKHPAAFDTVGAVVVLSTKEGAKEFVARHRAAMARGTEPADVAALGRKLPEVTFDKVPLGDILNFLRDVTATKFEVDWDGLKEAGIDRTTPVTVRARDVTLAQTLQLVLDDAWPQKAVGFTVKKGVITIARAPGEKDPPARKAGRPVAVPNLKPAG